MTYAEWMREGEDVLRAMPTPTPEEDAALALERQGPAELPARAYRLPGAAA